MRVILIDDEQLALMRLKDLLEKNIDDVKVVGVYQNSLQAYEEIESTSPDVVFLDIQMPGMNGLEVAEKIQENNNQIEIVYVTGYDKYAIEAFEIYAFDYILKPIQVERLKKTIQRLKDRIKNIQLPDTNDKDILIQCFNQLKVKHSQGESEALKWRTTKAQELFSFLIHNRGKIVNRETIIDLLWPSNQQPKSTQQLYTTIYHIRRTLKQYGLESISIVSGNGGYTLSVEKIQFDTEVWEHHLHRLEPITAKNALDHEKVFYDYTGDYLGSYGYLWAEGEKERLRRLWLNHGIRLSSFYHKAGNNEDAIKICQRMQQMYPDLEESYFELMKIYASMNKLTAVEEQYRMLYSLLSRELNLAPNQVITNWYENWKQGKY